MKLVLTLLIFIITFSSIYSQNCKCEKEFEFVIDYYEENLPGFKDNVNEKNVQSYNNFKKQLFQKAKSYCDNKTSCFKLLLTYVEFFKDNHSSIYLNNDINIDESKKEEVDAFLNSNIFKETEIFKNYTSKQNPSFNEIENIYQTDDEIYTVSIIKSKNKFRDYVGIITNSKTPLWANGQVKFELKKVNNNIFDMFLFTRNHSIQFHKNVKLENGIFNDGWFNVKLKNKIAYNMIYEKNLLFKQLDKETNYMYIPTFDGGEYAKINDFYNKNDSLIQSKPYLIIDVRNNGGGSDDCVSPLLKYIYTKPFNEDLVDIYATKENIRKETEFYEKIKNDTINFDLTTKRFLSEEIEKMKKSPNKSFIPRSTDSLVRLDTVLKNPSKIAIIINKNCASSCETLLFWGLESDKTILVGENSGGYVGYGEINEIKTPNFNFDLGCTMTRYNKQRKYEATGISPKYYLKNNKDWKEQTIELLKKN